MGFWRWPASVSTRIIGVTMMTAISKLVASERAKRYRQLAYEARFQASLSKRVPRYEGAYLSMAGRWEELALEADAEAEDLPGQDSAGSSAMADSPGQNRAVAEGSILVQRPA